MPNTVASAVLNCEACVASNVRMPPSVMFAETKARVGAAAASSAPARDVLLKATSTQSNKVRHARILDQRKHPDAPTAEAVSQEERP